MKQHQEALDSYDHALFLDPNLALAWNNKGYALWELKRYQEALDAYGRALSIAPNYLFWRSKALLLRELGRTKEAEAAEQQAAALQK